MFQKIIRNFVCIMLCMIFAAMTAVVNAQNESSSPVKLSHPQVPVNEKLEYYRHLYPEILFLVLEGGDELLDEIMVLDLVLGYQPSSLDYDHPPHLREDLMYVSIERIIKMLQYQAPSAALFKADNPLGWQEHVCVLTIAPHSVAADSIRATQHLLGLPEEFIRNIPLNLQLLPGDYLEFVFDHEVYHCLKSMYVGPQQKSHKEFWAEYNHFLNEQGADAYALGMHIKTRGEVSSFANNLHRIRNMSLYSADPDHLTSQALEHVLTIPAGNITEMNAKEIFDMANRIKDSLAIDYNEYLQFLASAVQAMKELGVGALVSDKLRHRLNAIEADPEKVKKLVTNARRSLAELIGNESEAVD